MHLGKAEEKMTTPTAAQKTGKVFPAAVAAGGAPPVSVAGKMVTDAAEVPPEFLLSGRHRRILEMSYQCPQQL